MKTALPEGIMGGMDTASASPAKEQSTRVLMKNNHFYSNFKLKQAPVHVTMCN